MMKIRIQKFLSQKGLFSRRECESMIRSGRLTIDGSPVKLGDRVDDSSIIGLDGELLEVPTVTKQKVLAYYKPRGVESTLKKTEGVKTLADIDFGGRFFPIGRLDKDSQGLLLLTNDGDLANYLAHPRYQKSKEYLVVLNKDLTGLFLKKITEGVVIGRKKEKTMACETEKIESRIFKIILKEGRNRQIRKMCEALGYKVLDLLRIRVGSCLLGEMKVGRYRVLSENEIKSLTGTVNL